MTRLYVDCDDTLALYGNEAGENPLGVELGYPWRPNEPLIDAINDFVAKYPRTTVIIWSGGGRDYAEEFRQRLLPDINASAAEKDDSVLDADCIVIDDCFFPACRHYFPDDLSWTELGH